MARRSADRFSLAPQITRSFATIAVGAVVNGVGLQGWIRDWSRRSVEFAREHLLVKEMESICVFIVMLAFPSEPRSDRIRRHRGAWMLSGISNGTGKGIQPKCAVAGRGRISFAFGFLCATFFWMLPGCATMRRNAPSPDLRPCTDGFAYTADGWRLGVRHYRPEHPDPGKLPVILCHGLGLNATFWTLTDHHLPSQLAARGYEVYVFDIRGSGENAQLGRHDWINRHLRQTFLRERGERGWTVDDLVQYDVPAILDYVARETGRDRVNWVGHSLGGMLVFPYLELAPRPERIANFVGMSSTIIQATSPQTDMLRANQALRVLSLFASPGRLGRPLAFFRVPGMERIDRFYYSNENVDRLTVYRFYSYTLEDTGPGALRQLAPYLREGHMYSSDRSLDYSAKLGEIATPTLLIAGDGDIMSDITSTELTLAGLGSPDKTIMRFGKSQGNMEDYGHCDLVWSRHAPMEIFPPLIDWLDQHQPGLGPSPQAISALNHGAVSASAQQ
jgi:pimeloyl-ACP methyl ester carboxylesterase